MTKPKLTPWFPADVKPVHVGWYHTDSPTRTASTSKMIESGFNWYWTGERWTYNSTPYSEWCREQNRQWRGLANKPRSAK